MKLPGTPYLATVRRTPQHSGVPVPVLSLVLRAPRDVLFQPEGGSTFTQQQGGAVVQRHLCFAEWPAGVTDPQPVRPGDQLEVTLPTAVSSAVVAGTILPQSFPITPGSGAPFAQGHPVTINGQTRLLVSAFGDTVLLDSPLSGPPAVGDVITQSVWHFAVMDANPWMGHHIEIFIRLSMGSA